MKTILSCCFLLFLFLVSKAQSLTPFVLSTGLNKYVGTSASLLFTAGTHGFISVSKTYALKIFKTEVYIPTTFTANKAGLNDVLKSISPGEFC